MASMHLRRTRARTLSYSAVLDACQHYLLLTQVYRYANRDGRCPTLRQIDHLWYGGNGLAYLHVRGESFCSEETIRTFIGRMSGMRAHPFWALQSLDDRINRGYSEIVQLMTQMPAEVRERLLLCSPRDATSYRRNPDATWETERALVAALPAIESLGVQICFFREMELEGDENSLATMEVEIGITVARIYEDRGLTEVAPLIDYLVYAWLWKRRKNPKADLMNLRDTFIRTWHAENSAHPGEGMPKIDLTGVDLRDCPIFDDIPSMDPLLRYAFWYVWQGFKPRGPTAWVGQRQMPIPIRRQVQVSNVVPIRKKGPK